MSDWMKMLNKMEGAVDEAYNPYAEGNFIRTVSPSLNYTFSKSPGLPLGEFLLLWGPPKAGKSIIANAMVAGLHAMDPKAFAVKFDTEMRSTGTEEPFWKIDQSRYKAFNVNEPELIFDRIKQDFLPMIQNGWPLKLIIIDSLQGVQGVKAANAKSVTDHQMGDHAMTIQKGLQAIMPILRRNNIALISTAHVRGNLDAGMYGPKEKMAGGWAQKHTYEYFMKITPNKNSADNSDLVADVKDFKGNAERTAHKIYIQMSESSRGVAGRTGQITFDYKQGIINTEEEIMELAKNLNLVERPNNRTYIVGENKYSSADDFRNAIKEDIELRQKLVGQIENYVKSQGRLTSEQDAKEA
jgi:hypothetical protein